MSDARAATDGDLEYWRDTVRSARATNTGTLLAATASMEALLARISADAARIRELEARQVPDGWQVVPKEPTVAMERSAAGRDTRDEGIASMYSGIYRANKVFVGVVQPGQNWQIDSGIAKRKCLANVGNPKVVNSGAFQSLGNLNRAMTVGVRLDHAHHLCL